ncbi:MAG: SDR family oxidoreductase [Lacibacter sp.]|nr:SDR family oxidoreductase [Lacibacter sp.]
MNVVITGASRGIGKAVAEIFAANGHALYLSSKSETAIYKTMAELQDKYPGIKIKAKARDLSKRDEVESFGQWVLDNSFNIDVLVNNAGNFLPGSVHNEEEGSLEEMIATNLYSSYHLTRKVLPQMMKQSPVSGSRGHIFNMCSIASLHAYKNGGAYSISKYAMHGFSKNLREEMKPHLIKVTSVFPGAVMTDSWGDYDNSSKRIMEAEDIAKMVYASSQLSPQACVEDIIIRPQLGDL